jgi:hypothetical protein
MLIVGRTDHTTPHRHGRLLGLAGCDTESVFKVTRRYVAWKPDVVKVMEFRAISLEVANGKIVQ